MMTPLQGYKYSDIVWDMTADSRKPTGTMNPY